MASVGLNVCTNMLFLGQYQ